MQKCYSNFFIVSHAKSPDMHAVSMFAILPATMAHRAKPPIIFDFDGHNALSVPITTPTDPKFAKPQRAYVEITIDFSFKIQQKKNQIQLVSLF